MTRFRQKKRDLFKGMAFGEIRAASWQGRALSTLAVADAIACDNEFVAGLLKELEKEGRIARLDGFSNSFWVSPTCFKKTGDFFSLTHRGGYSAYIIKMNHGKFSHTRGYSA